MGFVSDWASSGRLTQANALAAAYLGRGCALNLANDATGALEDFGRAIDIRERLRDDWATSGPLTSPMA